MEHINSKTLPAEKYEFMSGGGEMGELMRSKDWRSTPVGDPSGWPQSLRTTLSIILNSRFPMFLWWGPDLTCFYNDAYRPSLGNDGKHPFILGMEAEQAWPEIWATIKPLIDIVLHRGEATWSEDQLIPIYRNGKLEDVYWTFSYSPVNDESGKAAGVFVTCTETTDKINTLKNLEASRNEFQLAIEATELGTFDYNPLTNTFRANSRLKEWFGLQPDDEVLLDNAIASIAEKDKERVTTAIRQTLLFSTGGLYDIEYCIIHPATKKETIVRAKGRTWFGEDKIAYRFTGTLQDVSEQAKIRQQVEQSEKEFRQLADSLPEMIWTTNKNGEQTFASKRWKEFTGLDPYGAQSFKEIVHPDDLGAITQTWTRCLQSGEKYKIEARLKHSSGEYQWFFANGEPLKNDAGEIEKWVGTFVNINEQKKTEQNLINTFNKIEESEKRYRNVAERLNIVIGAGELGTWELNLITDEVTYSEKYLELFGHKKNDVPDHKKFLAQLHPHDKLVRDLAFSEAMKKGVLQYESRIFWDDGSIHWIEIKGKVFYDEKYQPSKILGTLRDITEEKNYQQGLEEREQKFRMLADSMPQFVWTGDASGNLNYFNHAVYEYSGLSGDNIRENGWLQIVHPDEREENVRKWMEAIATGKDFNFEHRFRRYDGEYRWQLSRAIPQKDITGKIRMWVGTSTDIQEMKKLEQEKDYFISLASHELKTPVTSIKGYVQMLQKMHTKSNDLFLKNSLATVDKQIVTLTNLITDLLDLSKIKTGILTLNKENFEITELVDSVIAEIKNIYPDYNIQFTKQKSAYVHADKERIGQVLINFLTNAVKYSPNSKKIILKSFIENNQAVVSVQDAGIGIQKKDQEKIFERFYRVEGKNEKTFPGFGIGLFIASEIVNRHNGKIGVESQHGKGSVFYFSLPLNS